MSVEKHRLGNFQMLAEPIDNALTVEISKAVPDFEEKLYAFAVDIWKMIEVVDEKINTYLSLIRQLAREKGVKLSVSGATCHRKSCMTCLGKYATHYPYFRVQQRSPTLLSREGLLAFVKKPEAWRHVRKRELKDFLRSLGMEEHRVKRFLQYCDLRDWLISNYHCQIVTFKWLGISSIELGESK